MVNKYSLIGMAQTIIGLISKNNPSSDDFPISERLVAQLIQTEIDILNQDDLEMHKDDPIDPSTLSTICVNLTKKNASICPCFISDKNILHATINAKFLTKNGKQAITFVGTPDKSIKFIEGEKPLYTSRFRNDNEYYYQIINQDIYVQYPLGSLLCNMIIIGAISNANSNNTLCEESEEYPCKPYIRGKAIYNVFAKYAQALGIDPKIIENKNDNNYNENIT